MTDRSRMKNEMRRLWHRISGYQDINGNGRSGYLHRWRLLGLPRRRRLYLHHFVGSDWSMDMHDHPKAFVSIGLRGGYVQEVPRDGMGPRQRTRAGTSWFRFLKSKARSRTRFRAPWVHVMPVGHVHRLRVPPRGCWTLVWTGPEVRDWGFNWIDEDGIARWQDWRAYVAKHGGPKGERT